MPVITSLKQQKNKNRVNVYLDDSFGFGIDLDNFVILNLKIGQELSQKEVNGIIKTAEFQKNLDKLLRFASVRTRSEKEFRDYFWRKKVPDVIHNDLFLKIKSFGFIDDAEFAKQWVESRQSYRPKPKRILEQELKIKGISKEIIKKVLDNTEIDEPKVALKLLEARESHWGRIETGRRRQKMTEYLVRKGFDFEIALSVAKSYNIDYDKTR